MKKYPSFKVDFLGCKITVIFDKDWREIARNILKRPLATDDSEVKSNAMVIIFKQDYYLLSNRAIKYGVLVHECFHLLMWIADDFDMRFNVNDHESMAYLLEYLIDEVMKIKKEGYSSAKCTMEVSAGLEITMRADYYIKKL